MTKWVLSPCPHPHRHLQAPPREVPELLHGGPQQAKRAPALAAAARRRTRRGPHARHLARPQVPVERQAHRLLRLLRLPQYITRCRNGEVPAHSTEWQHQKSKSQIYRIPNNQDSCCR